MRKNWRRWVALVAAGLGMPLLLVRLAAGSPLVRDGHFLDGLDYLPPWPLAVLVLPLVLVCLAVRQRRIALLLGGTCLVLLLLEEDLSWRRRVTPVAGAPVLKIAAWNVQYYRGGRERVVEAVKSMDADVVLLSENDVLPKDVPQLEALFAPLYFHTGRPEETAIVSRRPVREVKEVELPSTQASLRRPNRFDRLANRPHRAFMHAQIDVDGVLVHVISIRFIAGRPPSQSAADQLAWGRYLLKTHHEEGRFFVDYLSRLQGPIVFGGDLNATPSSQVIRDLTDIAQDAYLETHWWGRPTFEVRYPLLRLDYLFGMNGAVALASTRLPVQVSDHFPVWASFALSPSTQGTAATSAHSAGASSGSR